MNNFLGTIGDCADDLLGGGNAASLEDAKAVRDMLKKALDVMNTYIDNVEQNRVIADHNLDRDTVDEVCDFFYGLMEGVEHD